MNYSNSVEIEGIVMIRSESEAVLGTRAAYFELAAEQEILRQNVSCSIRENAIHSGGTSCG